MLRLKRSPRETRNGINNVAERGAGGLYLGIQEEELVDFAQLASSWNCVPCDNSSLPPFLRGIKIGAFSATEEEQTPSCH